MIGSRTRRGFVFGTAGISAGVAGCYQDARVSPSHLIVENDGGRLNHFPKLPQEEAAGIAAFDSTFPPGDVRRYGAVGDAVTDDSAAIQMAIDVAAHTNNWRVTFSPGTYLVRVPITDSARSSESKLVLFGNRCIVRVETGGGEFLKLMAPGIRVSGLVIDGSSSSYAEPLSAAILIGDTRDITIDECEFEAVPNVCVSVLAESSGCTDVRITRCNFNGSRGSAIYVGTAGESVRVERLFITGCSFVAPAVPNHDQTRAIHLASGAHNCYIAQNSLAGIATADYLVGWRDGIMIGNSASLNQPSSVMISENLITGMADDGVGIAGARQVSIRGNIIHGSIVTSGVYCPANAAWVNTDVVIADNTLFNHHLAGIFLKDTVNFTITGNEIHDCKDGIEVIHSSSGQLAIEGGIVANNHIHHVRQCGILCHGARIVANSNLVANFGFEEAAQQTRRMGIFLSSLKSGSSISGNAIVNGQHGILLTGSSYDFVISNNSCSAIAGFGLYFIDFTGEDWIITGNRLAGVMGQSANRPASDQRRIWLTNL
jgi:parallel beta-helix repeat protein